MLVKFQSKSSRVKGICFHESRPWILASLYSGIIQLWDYRLGSMIGVFQEHEGPVRAIQFHYQQPIFASGADDTLVWNYQTSKCLFSLSGHMDYVRSVCFHRECPWLASSSDDQTIRIWNWQSRACVSIVTGHNHYVLHVEFHISQLLLLSASLDQTIRIWDLSGLRDKFYKPGDKNTSQRLGAIDVLTPMDVFSKIILEGHTQGVNWASFHPTQPLIVSASDDRTLKIWRYSGYGANEIATLRGHYNNVSSAEFSSDGEYIISIFFYRTGASEDKTIRIWDANKHTVIGTHRRESDRCWVVAISSNSSAIAVGHDSGLVIFKTSRERPAHDVFNGQIFYIKVTPIKKQENSVRRFDPIALKDSVIVDFKKIKRYQPFRLHYNPVEHLALIDYVCLIIIKAFPKSETDSQFFEIVSIPSDKSKDTVDTTKHNGVSCVWVGRNRIALIKDNQLQLRSLNEQLWMTPEFGKCDKVFYAGTGQVLIQVGDKILLVDVKDRCIISTVSFQNVRFVKWSPSFEYVALVNKQEIQICSRKLDIITSVYEALPVKSVTWTTDDQSILLYTTPCHLKYLLVPWGTIDSVLYIAHSVLISEDQSTLVACLDRKIRPRVLKVDTTECRFKLAVLRGHFEEVLRIVRSSNLVGQALLSFVRSKGLPEIALHFIRDPIPRFNLSLECCNLELALTLAKEIDQPQYWRKLASISIKLGVVEVAEQSFLRISDNHNLSFLYAISGNIYKLNRLPKLDPNFDSKLVSLMLINDSSEIAKILSSSGSQCLGHALSIRHGLDNVTSLIAKNLPEDYQPTFPDEKATPFYEPSTPLFNLPDRWPELAASKSIFDLIADKSDNFKLPDIAETDLLLPQGDWLDDVEIEDQKENVSDEPDPNAWQISDDDLNIDVELTETQPIIVESNIEPLPLYLDQILQQTHPIVSIIKGSFDQAIIELKQKFGLKQVSPLKQLFMMIFTCSKILIKPLLSNDPFFSYPFSESTIRQLSPISLDQIRVLMKNSMQLTTSGKFQDASSMILDALHRLMFLIIIDKNELKEIKSIVHNCREYLLGLKIELDRRNLQDNQIRSAELAAYFTHCDIQPMHHVLALRSAMSLSFKLKNYKTASNMAQRVLDYAPSVEVCTQARKIIVASQKEGNTNAQVLNYDELNPFDICAGSLTPIYKGEKFLSCSFCQAAYQSKFSDICCIICKIGTVGISAPGFSIETNI